MGTYTTVSIMSTPWPEQVYVAVGTVYVTFPVCVGTTAVVFHLPVGIGPTELVVLLGGAVQFAEGVPNAAG